MSIAQDDLFLAIKNAIEHSHLSFIFVYLKKKHTMRNRISLSLLGMMFFVGLMAQQPGKYRVTFTDKSNSPYSIANPLAFLSQRAIDRRILHGVPVTMQDIPVNPAYINGVKSTGVEVINRSKWFNSAIVTISSTPQYTLISALPYVSSVEYVAPLPLPFAQSRPQDKLTPIDMKPLARVNPNLSDKPSVTKIQPSVIDYGMAANQASMIAVDLLHNAGYTGQGKIIAVIDAGFTNANTLTVFDSLYNSGRILGAVDFAENGANVYSAHSHGTMVLSIMGGNIPTQMVGTAPHAHYWLLRSEIGSSEYIVEEDNWVAAAEFADSAGVDIINSSLGYTVYYDALQSHTYASMDGNTTRVTIGADIAASKGMIVVNSAGNEGSSSWGYIGAPADGDSVLAIGAVDYAGTYVSFSSRGPSYDGRIKPDVAAQGSGTTIADIWGNISAGSGTSFSSPVIAGAVACLWQAVPNMTNMEVVQAIRQSAHKYANPDTLVGYGIPNFAAAATILGADAHQEREIPFTVYPNPFNTSITWVWHGSEVDGLSVTLYDMMGRMNYSRQTGRISSGQSVSLDGIEDLAQGMYLLQIRSSDGKKHSLRVLKGL